MQTRNFYEEFWVDGHDGSCDGHSAELARLVDGHVRGRVLDFGCGNGRGKSSWLSGLAAEYVGVDISQRAVDEARRLGYDAHRADGELPFEDASFDTVVSIDVLEHLFAPHEATAEWLRVLRPGGVVLAAVPNAAYWRRRVDLGLGRWNPLGSVDAVAEPWRDPHIRFFTTAALARLMVASGYDEVTVHGYNGAFLRDVPGLRRLGRGGSSGLYRAIERRLPSLCGYSLVATARKPA